jgi:hypothetical protein
VKHAPSAVAVYAPLNGLGANVLASATSSAVACLSAEETLVYAVRFAVRVAYLYSCCGEQAHMYAARHALPASNCINALMQCPVAVTTALMMQQSGA